MCEKLRDNIEIARMSKWLATINVEAPVEFTWEDLEFTDPDIEKLTAIYTELEFNAFLKKLQAEGGGAVSASPAVSADLLSGFEDIKRVSFEEFLSSVKEGSEVFVEAATDANHLTEPEIGSIVLYSAEEKLASVKELTLLDDTIAADALGSKNYRLCGCGLKRIIYSLIYKSDAEFIPAFDAEVAEYLLDANRQKYPLDKLLLRYCSYAADESEWAFLSDAASYDSSALNNDDLLKRAYYVSKVMPHQIKALEEMGSDRLFGSCEMPLVLTLARMEYAGIKCDPEILKNIGEELSDEIEKLEAAIYEEAGTEFNINSPKQLGVILFENMG
ncbi:MAG: hypothetical protein IJ227_03485, partial [Mogibacterium sp.]|nr:hypothetical protein [Mogibacterium sp.]